jgi:hypothetical protein
MANPSDAPSYENALTAVSDEIQELLKKRSAIDFRLNQLKKIADAYASLMTPPPFDSDQFAAAAAGMLGMSSEDISGAGITDAIRQVLRDSKVPLRPTDIKTALVARGFDISGYANPGTVIHNTLTRLEKQGEITAIQSSFGPSYAAAAGRNYKNLPTLDDPENPLYKSGVRDFKKDHPDKK